MDKKLVLGALLALAVGFVAGKSSGASYLDGRVNGCNTAMNALTGGQLKCEAQGKELFVTSPMLQAPVNLDKLPKAE